MMLPRVPGRRGFTLIELALALVLIGILAGMAVYTYRQLVNKARMTQAKSVLSHLFRMEMNYHADHDRYTDNTVLLDFDPVKYPYYTVTVVIDNNGTNFTGIAAGVGPMAGDWWTITNEGIPVQSDNSTFR